MAIVKLTALLLLLLPGQLWALATDREQPIEIEADELEVRELERVSIYLGNVVLVQGSLEINADRLVIHFNEANELTLMEMTGKPATLRQLDDNQQELWGEAMRIDYTQSKSLLELRESALIKHAGDVVESELIRINTETSSLQAGGTESDERVKMLIQPRQDSADPE
jgi:lipopolysaccharide export system protein LptA